MTKLTDIPATDNSSSGQPNDLGFPVAIPAAYGALPSSTSGSQV